ncbi:MAG: hypothetical protein L3J39_16130 [Verrucomicrobiales bacterium]|nr:hypothetical protein [Verrucomicrobiales bacterium]
MKTKRKVIYAIGLLLLLPMVAFAILSPNYHACGITLAAKQTKSLNNLKQIDLSLRTYAIDYDNQLPTSFSVLIPEYIDTDEIFYHPRNPFGNASFNPYRTYSTKKLSPKKMARILSVDFLSTYRLFHRPETNWAFIHEPPYMWEDGSMAWISLEKDPNGEWINTGNMRGNMLEFEAAIISKLESSPPPSPQ